MYNTLVSTLRETSPNDRIALGSSLFAISVLSYFFFISDFSRETPGGEQIAVMTKVQNQVRRKSASSLAWFPISEKSGLYQNDQVFTNDTASGEIKFDKGPLIKISPNTLLKISRSEDGIDLSSDQGLFDIALNEGGPKVKVKRRGEELTLESKAGKKTSVQISSQAGEENSITVTGGELRIKSKGSDLNIREGEKLDLRNEKLAVEKLNLLALSPSLRQSIIVHPELPVRFSWKSYGEELSELRLHLEGVDEKKIFEVSGNSALISLSIEGRYKWYLTGKLAEKNISSNKIAFNGIPLSAPLPRAPQSGSSFEVASNQSGRKTEITFEGARDSVSEFSAEVELLKGEKKTTLEVPMEGRNGQKELILRPGNYRYRLRSKISREGKIVFSPWTRGLAFSLVKSNPIILRVPKNGERVALKDIRATKFSWGRAREISPETAKRAAKKSYKVYIARDPQFKKRIFQKVTKTKELAFARKWSAGTYYWMVQEANGPGKSEIFSFTVSAPAETLQEEGLADARNLKRDEIDLDQIDPSGLLSRASPESSLDELKSGVLDQKSLEALKEKQLEELSLENYLSNLPRESIGKNADHLRKIKELDYPLFNRLAADLREEGKRRAKEEDKEENKEEKDSVAAKEEESEENRDRRIADEREKRSPAFDDEPVIPLKRRERGLVASLDLPYFQDIFSVSLKSDPDVGLAWASAYTLSPTIKLEYFFNSIFSVFASYRHRKVDTTVAESEPINFDRNEIDLSRFYFGVSMFLPSTFLGALELGLGLGKTAVPLMAETATFGIVQLSVPQVMEYFLYARKVLFEIARLNAEFKFKLGLVSSGSEENIVSESGLISDAELLLRYNFDRTSIKGAIFGQLLRSGTELTDQTNAELGLSLGLDYHF